MELETAANKRRRRVELRLRRKPRVRVNRGYLYAQRGCCVLRAVAVAGCRGAVGRSRLATAIVYLHLYIWYN